MLLHGFVFECSIEEYELSMKGKEMEKALVSSDAFANNLKLKWHHQ